MAIRCYIGLGSNLGRRALQLKAAVEFFELQVGITLAGQSRVYETPAMLPENAPAQWNIPYLNQVLAIDTTLKPEALLAVLKQCETALGRQMRERWGPRELDCDLLLYGEDVVETEQLVVPHPHLGVRDFVLVPLSELAPEKLVPGTGKTVRLLLEALSKRDVWLYVPPKVQLMGVVNVTPDSFSDHANGAEALEKIARLVAEGADIIDIGGESTRPGAQVLTADEEWARVGPVMEACKERSWILSVDTYHAETARRALEAGADWINDVSGAKDEAMLAVVAKHKATLVAMHSLSVPADPGQVMAEDANPVQVIIDWANVMIARAEAKGVTAEKLVLDPGIGFGKSAVQSFELLSHMAQVVRAVPEVKWLVGHSRKSFLTLFTKAPAAERDAATLAVSAMLLDSGVDYLRVHDVAKHRALVDSWGSA